SAVVIRRCRATSFRSSCRASGSGFTVRDTPRSCGRVGDSATTWSSVRSLRTRLLLFLIGGAAVPLLAAGFAVRTLVVNSLQEEFDGALWARAKSLATLTGQQGGRIEFEFDSDHMPEFSVGAEPEYFELWLATGSLLRRSPSFDAGDATRHASLVR